MTKTPHPVTAFGMALMLQSEASFPDLMKIKVKSPDGYIVPLDEFLVTTVFIDENGEVTSDPVKAVLMTTTKTGMYSHHTTYCPVANLVVDVQTYPSPAHRDHKVTVGEEDDDGDDDHQGLGFDDPA